MQGYSELLLMLAVGMVIVMAVIDIIWQKIKEYWEQVWHRLT